MTRKTHKPYKNTSDLTCNLRLNQFKHFSADESWAAHKNPALNPPVSLYLQFNNEDELIELTHSDDVMRIDCDVCDANAVLMIASHQTSELDEFGNGDSKDVGVLLTTADKQYKQGLASDLFGFATFDDEWIDPIMVAADYDETTRFLKQAFAKLDVLRGQPITALALIEIFPNTFHNESDETQYAVAPISKNIVYVHESLIDNCTITNSHGFKEIPLHKSSVHFQITQI